MDDFDFNDESSSEQIISLITDEMGGLKRRLAEIKDQIDSMQTSVDREQNRYSNIATELRSIKDNIDTMPRDDISNKYEEALDVRFRLATMRGQLEKFEGNYETLQHNYDLLGDVLDRLREFAFVPADDDNGSGAVGGGGLDIVSIIRTQDEERQRLARAMHDGPAQSLTNFILQAEIVQKLFSRNPDRASQELGKLKEDASKTFQKVRDFIFDLRPMMLDDLGVIPTVRRYVEAYRERQDIDVQLEVFGEERRLINYMEVMIFRGVQDAMGLARDYANPTEIHITLDIGDNRALMSIEDNGRGFDADGLFDSSDDETYTDARVQALQMLKSKFELVGGSIDVRSDETDGTTVRLELPIE